MHLLIVEDDISSRQSLVALAINEDCKVEEAETLASARAAMTSQHFDLVLLDIQLPDGNGMDLVTDFHKDGSEVVLISGHGDLEIAVDAMRSGVADFLTKPIDIDRLRKMLSDQKRKAALQGAVHSLRSQLKNLGRFGQLVGASEPMQELFGLIEKVAPTNASVMITGETGAGKEVVASTIHELSPRAHAPFVSLNCGAIPKDLIAAELFGHDKGAFTGASKARKGCFERAHQGTLFLDEIGEMPLEQQVSLLRVIETGLVTRVGSEQETAVDVRMLAATNRPPKEAVEEGFLREDLLFRLSVFPLTVPPLRERLDDIPLLCDHFLSQLESEVGGRKQISTAGMKKLQRHEYPGNVRELRNLLHRAAILAQEVIQAPDIPLDAVAPTAVNGAEGAITIPLGSSIAQAEKLLILATLESVDEDKNAAAKILGISVKTLYTRLNSYKDA